jgi:hypothetical protein
MSRMGRDTLKCCVWHIFKIYMFVKDDGVDGSNWSNLIKLDLEFYDVGSGPWEFKRIGNILANISILFISNE